MVKHGSGVEKKLSWRLMLGGFPINRRISKHPFFFVPFYSLGRAVCVGREMGLSKGRMAILGVVVCVCLKGMQACDCFLRGMKMR